MPPGGVLTCRPPVSNSSPKCEFWPIKSTFFLLTLWILDLTFCWNLVFFQKIEFVFLYFVLQFVQVMSPKGVFLFVFCCSWVLSPRGVCCSERPGFFLKLFEKNDEPIFVPRHDPKNLIQPDEKKRGEKYSFNCEITVHYIYGLYNNGVTNSGGSNINVSPL